MYLLYVLPLKQYKTFCTHSVKTWTVHREIKQKENGQYDVMRRFTVCALYLMLLRVTKSRRLSWQGHGTIIR